jgi:MoaA/NifB/PqqE/SkfB family radical SAM enzyme
MNIESIYSEKYQNQVINSAKNVPQSVSIEVTSRCQLNCIYCSRDKSNIKDMSLNELRMIKGQLGGVRQIIICGIGESFCYPEIYQIPEIFSDFKLSIITNGAIPIDFSRLTSTGNLKLLVFSIDATTPEKMSKICGGYNFQALENNLIRLWKYPNIARIINTTLNQYNIDEIGNLVRFAARYRMHAINFELPIGYHKFVEDNRLVIHGKIKEAAKIAKECNVILNRFFRLSCTIEDSIVPNIRLDGKLYPCCYGTYIGKSIGDIRDKRIDEIWIDKVSALFSDSLCRKCDLLNSLLEVSLD